MNGESVDLVLSFGLVCLASIITRTGVYTYTESLPLQYSLLRYRIISDKVPLCIGLAQLWP